MGCVFAGHGQQGAHALGKTVKSVLAQAAAHSTPDARSYVFTGHGKQELRVLGKTVKSVLKEAAAHGMQSVAMPLIGHGNAGWPAKLAAQIHVEQVLRFFKSCKAGASLQVLRCMMLTGNLPCSVSFAVTHL